VKILIDMNLSPAWVRSFEQEKWEAVHWSSVGKADAPDSEVLQWAREKNYILFTHDLDFGNLPRP
jgi:predicted nuclease of predicted toxin-antitoxin system